MSLLFLVYSERDQWGLEYMCVGDHLVSVQLMMSPCGWWSFVNSMVRYKHVVRQHAKLKQCSFRFPSCIYVWHVLEGLKSEHGQHYLVLSTTICWVNEVVVGMTDVLLAKFMIRYSENWNGSLQRGLQISLSGAGVVSMIVSFNDSCFILQINQWFQHYRARDVELVHAFAREICCEIWTTGNLSATWLLFQGILKTRTRSLWRIEWILKRQSGPVRFMIWHIF